MRTWAELLGGLILWTVHFFALYIVASIWLTTPLARGLTLAITVACLGAVAFFLIRVQRRRAETPMDRWVQSVASLGLGIAGIAILWQGLPALLI
jgi:uncharacterized membrane protein (DUF485 family)